MKSKNGITLIVLVVTVIVLVILTGVTVSFIISDDGIIANTVKMELETAKGEVRDHFLLLINEEILAASNDIVNTTEDISTRFNEPNLIYFLMGNQNFSGENAEEGAIKCIEEYVKGSSESTVVEEIVPKAGDRMQIKNIYRVDVSKLSPDSSKYGKGKNISEGDVFTLEAMTESDRNEDGKLLSTGKFLLKYYDKSGKETILQEVALYLTNQS